MQIRGTIVGAGLSRPVGIVGKARLASATILRSWSGWNQAASGRLPSTRAAGVQQASPSQSPFPAGSSGAQPFDGLIRDTARREGVDEQLVRAVIEAESSFNPRAVSPAGAKGLMQLMDGTARSLGVQDSFDPASNVDGGVRFLRHMLERFNSVPLALAAYNAGPGAVEKFGGIPPYQETKVYVDRVLRLHRQNQEEAAQARREVDGVGEHAV